ncbi:MAG: polysaccharide biosynthesis tyrosine autokinase [Pirellulaceae bacterium]
MICNDDQHAAPHQSGMIASPHASSPAFVVNGDHMMGVDGASADATSLDGYLHAFRRNWLWCLLLGGVFALAVGVAIWFLVEDRYTAFAELRAHATPRHLLDEGANHPQEKFETYINSVKQLITSRSVLTEALRSEEVQGCSIVQEQRDQEGWLAKELSVAIPRDSQMLLVKMTSPDPEESATIVNAVVETYLDTVQAKERGELNDKRDTLANIHENLLDEEQNKRNTLKNLAEQLGTVDREELSLAKQIDMEQARHIQRELINAKVQHQQAMTDLEMAKKQLERVQSQGVPEDELQVMLAMDPEGRYLTNEQEMLSRAVKHAGDMSRDSGAAERSGLGGVQFRITDLKEQVESLKESLAMQWRVERRKELEAAIQEKESLAEVLDAQVDKWESEYDQYQDVESIGENFVDVELQRKDIERLGKEIDQVTAQLSRTKIELERQPRVELISQAVPPRTANKPGRRMLTAAAGLFAFMLPSVGLLFWDVRSQRVNTPDEVSERLGLPLMGSVPILPSRVTRRLGGASSQGRWWQALLSESIAGIRANLLYQGDVHTVMVSSAVGGEGKTTVATQLAMSLARAGKRTALVDFDLSRPSVSSVFNLDLEPGVCDILRGECCIEDAVNDTVLSNLYVIPAGIANAASTQAMNSLELPQLLHDLRAQFDYVIVDGSPLVPVADARVVSRYVDGAICCVLRDVSRLSMVRRASDILENFDVRLLGTVVTAPQESYYMSRAVRQQHEETPV